MAADSAGQGGAPPARPAGWRGAVRHAGAWLAGDWRLASPVLRSRAMRGAMAVLLVVDAAILLAYAAHALARLGWLASPFGAAAFDLGTDGGVAEWWEYAKSAACVLALAAAFGLSRQPVHAALALVFGFLLLDNALTLHERWGYFAEPLFWRAGALLPHAPSHLAEFSFFALVGGPILLLLLLAMWRSAPPHRTMGLVFGLLLLVLAGLGAGVDLAHALLVPVGTKLDYAVTMIEDGGELVVLSLTFALALATALHLRQAAQR